MDETTWSREIVIKEINGARKKYGITAADYVRHLFYNVPDEEKYNKGKEIIARKERTKKHREQCISLAMEKCGWTEEEAKTHVEATKARTGISYMDYRRYHFFDISDEDQVERYEEIKASRLNRKNRDNSKKEVFYEIIMNETGWTRKELINKISDAKQRTGASWKDYYAFRFWEINEEEQSKYFTQQLSNLLSQNMTLTIFIEIFY